MHFVYRPSIDPGGLECQYLVDKDNGNITVASDVDPEYMPLLKAAPKLLDACQEFVRFAQIPDHTVPRGTYIRYQVLALGAAKKAIAEVEGQEPED